MPTKKKVKAGHIELDVQAQALVVHYMVDITELDDDGKPIGKESQPGKKVIKVRPKNQDADIQTLAKDIVSNCKYINASKTPDIEQLLRKLLNKAEVAESDPGSPSPVQGGGSAPSRPGILERLLPEADMRNLDEYIDELYEENMEAKVTGARRLLRLCMDPPNLEALSEHDTMLGILSRELRDNVKRGHDLSLAIACCFLCFAHFSQFHSLLAQNQCGDVTMRIVEYESKRYGVWRQEVENRRRQINKNNDNEQQLAAMKREEEKFSQMLLRHDRLMVVCLQILQNFSEDVAVERKIASRKINTYLAQVLERTDEDLLLVSMAFVKKLSIFECNKKEFIQSGGLPRLVALASHSSAYVALLALRTLYNFSFDKDACAILINEGLGESCVSLLAQPPLRQVVLRLLYHFSLDANCRGQLAQHEQCAQLVMQLVVHFPEQRVGQDLVALCINLATNAKGAEHMVDSGLFPQVVSRAVRTKDSLLFKVLRHAVSHNSQVREKFFAAMNKSNEWSWLRGLVRLASSSIETPELLVEIVGMLACLTDPDVPWSMVCEAGLVDLLQRLLVVGFSDDDIMLECIMLVGVVALDLEVVPLLSGSKLLHSLEDLLLDKREDEDLTVQLLFTIRCLLFHEETREALLQHTDMPVNVMEILHERNEVVQNLANEILDLIVEHDGCSGRKSRWAERVKQARFEAFNEEWCRVVLRGDSTASAQGMEAKGRNSVDGRETRNSQFEMRWTDASGLADRQWGCNMLNVE